HFSNTRIIESQRGHSDYWWQTLVEQKVFSFDGDNCIYEGASAHNSALHHDHVFQNAKFKPTVALLWTGRNPQPGIGTIARIFLRFPAPAALQQEHFHSLFFRPAA